MNYNAYSFVMDFALMSILLVVAQLLRAKIKFLQNFYIPSSVIGGARPDFRAAGAELDSVERQDRIVCVDIDH